jgi:hypothetical protein
MRSGHGPGDLLAQSWRIERQACVAMLAAFLIYLFRLETWSFP